MPVDGGRPTRPRQSRNRSRFPVRLAGNDEDPAIARSFDDAIYEDGSVSITLTAENGRTLRLANVERDGSGEVTSYEATLTMPGGPLRRLSTSTARGSLASSGTLPSRGKASTT